MKVDINVLQKAKEIKLVVFDIDGVLTDGVLLYSSQGEELKRFNVKDGVGIKLLRSHGIEVGVISAKSSGALAKRISDLGIKHFYPGSKDKTAAFQDLLRILKLSPSEVAYVGDDVIDLTVMKDVHLPIAVKDAYWLVKKYSEYTTDSKGGEGVAREVADLILSSRMNLEEAYIKAMLPEFEEKPA